MTIRSHRDATGVCSHGAIQWHGQGIITFATTLCIVCVSMILMAITKHEDRNTISLALCPVFTRPSTALQSVQAGGVCGTVSQRGVPERED